MIDVLYKPHRNLHVIYLFLIIKKEISGLSFKMTECINTVFSSSHDHIKIRTKL